MALQQLTCPWGFHCGYARQSAIVELGGFNRLPISKLSGAAEASDVTHLFSIVGNGNYVEQAKIKRMELGTTFQADFGKW